MNQNLLQSEVQDFILQNKHADVQQLLLQGIHLEGVSASEIAEQIIGLRAFSTKAPDMVRPFVLYPPKLNIEQTSSELTASYKKKLLPTSTNSFIDITGGYGVDFYYLSEGFTERVYCEKNELLANTVKHNFEVYNRKIEVIIGNGVEWLKATNRSFDSLFVDPSRREGNQKVISLNQSAPNLLEIWELLLQKASSVMVKLSPMLDISYLLQTLPNIKEVHVIAVKQDVKEIVILAQQEFIGNPKIVAASLGYEETRQYISHSRNQVTYLSTWEDYHFLYEPFSVLLKAGLQDEYAVEHHIDKIGSNTHLYASHELNATPMCKQFQILGRTKLNRKEVNKITGEDRINVVCRNYPLQPAEVLKKMKMKQGGSKTLFCFSQQGKKHYLVGERI